MIRYKMLARDVDAQPVQYRTWVVDDTPDLTAQFYTGDKSGPNPLVDISSYVIFDPNQVVDFNLPNPLDWNTTYQVLPTYVCDGQLAVLDGYIYLFGGQNSNKILRASVNNPATMVDTGATLPITGLAGSQLAIINGVIYLFGGTTDATFGSATDIILSAPTSNPLNWTNQGSLLPNKLHHSQLAIINSSIYLFGGSDDKNAVSDILTAPISNPLSWSKTGYLLPTPLYGSHLSIIDGYMYLFGGLTSLNNSTNLILTASINSPTAWGSAGSLPYSIFYGQFCTIGSHGYLFTSTNNITSNTKILRCDLNTPNQWIDTQYTIKGSANQSHLAIVYDRIWLYGGSGSTVILANNSILKYNFNDPAVLQYGNITRTQVQQAPDYLSLFQVLGFAPWHADYGSFSP